MMRRSSSTGNNKNNGFKIILKFGKGLTREQRQVFQRAARKWEQVIRGTTSTTTTTTTTTTSPDTTSPPPLPRPRLSLRIHASAPSIDGPGRVLGRAGPTFVREWDGLPVEGIMEFDAADLMDMQQAGTLQHVILHVRTYSFNQHNTTRDWILDCFVSR